MLYNGFNRYLLLISLQTMPILCQQKFADFQIIFSQISLKSGGNSFLYISESTSRRSNVLNSQRSKLLCAVLLVVKAWARYTMWAHLNLGEMFCSSIRFIPTGYITTMGISKRFWILKYVCKRRSTMLDC